MKRVFLIMMATLPTLLFAQQKETGKEVERIIITKKNNNSEKLNIVVDGDKITVNGSPVSEDQKGDITVQRIKIKDLDNFSPNMQGSNNNGLMMMPTSPNKAMLGVITEKTENGVVVRNVSEASAAEKAGLKKDDIITAVEGVKIESPDQLSQALKDKNPGDKVAIGYTRDGKEMKVQVELTKWQAPSSITFQENPSFNFSPNSGYDIEELMRRMPRNYNDGNNYRIYNYPNASPKLGIKVQDLETTNGVKVMDVEKGSTAERGGIKTGDIIKEVDGVTISNTDDLVALTQKSKTGSILKMKIDRNGRTQNVHLLLSKKAKSANL